LLERPTTVGGRRFATHHTEAGTDLRTKVVFDSVTFMLPPAFLDIEVLDVGLKCILGSGSLTHNGRTRNISTPQGVIFFLKVRKRSVSASRLSVGGCERWPEVDTYESVHLGNKWEVLQSDRKRTTNDDIQTGFDLDRIALVGAQPLLDSGRR